MITVKLVVGLLVSRHRKRSPESRMPPKQEQNTHEAAKLKFSAEPILSGNGNPTSSSLCKIILMNGPIGPSNPSPQNFLNIYFFQKFKNTSSKAAASEEQQLWYEVFQP
jgi:hypothetical protein